MARRVSIRNAALRYSATRQREHAQKVKLVLRRIIELSCGAGRDFAMELASLLGQCDPCPKCGGTGSHTKHINCSHGCEEAWIRGCDESVVCRRCHGCGYLLRQTQEQSA